MKHGGAHAPGAPPVPTPMVHVTRTTNFVCKHTIANFLIISVNDSSRCMLIALQTLVSHCKRVADVYIIAHCGSQVLKILMLSFVSHGPMPNQWTNPGKEGGKRYHIKHHRKASIQRAFEAIITPRAMTK